MSMSEIDKRGAWNKKILGEFLFSKINQRPLLVYSGLESTQLATLYGFQAVCGCVASFGCRYLEDNRGKLQFMPQFSIKIVRG